jgi:hypothetical protein
MNPKRRYFFKVALALVSLILVVAIAEIGRRIVLSQHLGLTYDERNLSYQYDETLGWFPINNSKKIVSGNRPIEARHNSIGFRDAEHPVDSRKRIIFLGDSYVWGYDAEEQERFTELLDERLPEVAVYNLGVSGYGTDQQYLLLREYYAHYRPDIVFLVFCAENDRQDNSSNIRYKGYYKPYFIADGYDLMLRGVPVPKSENYFFLRHKILSQSYLFRGLMKSYFRLTSPTSVNTSDPTHAIIENMHQFSETGGAEFLVGIIGEDKELEHFLKDRDIKHLNLTNPYRYPYYGGHWTPEGHTFVADRIHDFLVKGKFIQGSVLTQKPGWQGGGCGCHYKETR